MKLTVLGYLGGYPDAGHATSTYLIESGDYHLLMDLTHCNWTRFC